MRKVLTAAALLWALGLLVILYRYSENGRYQISSGGGAVIIDTRTGAIYEGTGMGGEVKQVTKAIN
jgi:hypothetical protein